MQVSIETTTGLERRLTVGVPAERIDQEVDTRLQKAAKNVRLDGFRPGKVPMRVMRQRFGEGVRQEVIGEVVNQSFFEAVSKEQLQPAGQPSIEPKEIAPGKDLQYVATFEIYPEIALGDFGQIKVEKPVADVADADVDKMIEVFRKQQGGFQAVDRAAADGDQVNIDFKGTKDGETFEGGSAEGTDLLLGSGRMIAGFEAGIEGMKAGEEKTLSLSFPDDYHSEELKGAAVEFVVKVNTVSEQALAELDDAFFSQYGVKDGGEEAFRAEVTNNMGRELKSAVKNKVKQQVMEQLADLHEVQLPASLIKGEIGVLKRQMFQQFGQASQELDESILPDDMFTEQAERRVKLGLVIGELIKRDSLQADPLRVRETIEEMASTYEDPEEVVNHYYGNQELLQSVEAAVLEDQAMDVVLEAATVEEKAQSYEDALAPLEQQDDE